MLPEMSRLIGQRGRFYRMYSYFMGGLALAMIVLLYLLHRWIESGRGLP
jgi:hypothetical protein